MKISFLRKCVLAVLAVLFGGAQPAAAQTFYTATRTLSGGTTVQLVIETNGVQGLVSGTDIASWSVIIDSPTTDYSYTDSTGSMTFGTSHLSADANGLTYDFSTTGDEGVIFRAPGNIALYCFGTGSFCPDSESASFGGSDRTAHFTVPTQIADAVVPEPGAWAMMIGGFLVAGSALRTRRRRMLRLAA